MLQQAVAIAEPQPEVLTADQRVSTFSLNVSDVSFKLAAASLDNGVLPEPATVRTEEFINALDYRDPEPVGDAAVALNWERARYPFAHNRELLRFSVRTAAQGRALDRPLNLVLLLDNSGSMERADRVGIIREAMRVLADQIQPQDRVSVVSFARSPRLWVDGLAGTEAKALPELVGELTPEGGTNLEDALNAAYETAARNFIVGGVNRVVLLTDGAANLGEVEPRTLQSRVESNRLKGIALDCFGIGWEGYNDDLLETLSRHGDGRYGFVNSPDEAATGFADQLAGALQIAAANVKVQIEFNPARVAAYRQLGYAKHQLTEEQFRDNTVDAAEIAAAESGNALYVAEIDEQGQGPIGVVRARYQDPATSEFHEQEWGLPYLGPAPALETSSATLRLAGAAAAFAEWLTRSPFAAEVAPDRLLRLLEGVPEAFDLDPRPEQLRRMITQGMTLAGGSSN
jgi:Mg-chelatase subunit ChlD